MTFIVNGTHPQTGRYQAIVHSENRILNKRKEGTSSGFILYLGYRLDKKQGAPALTRTRWSFDVMDSDPEEIETDNEKDIEVREEVETRGIHGKVSLLYEVTFLLTCVQCIKND